MPVPSEMGADPPRLVCDAGSSAGGLAARDRLARLALGARRRGLVLEVRNAGAGLVELAALAGLVGTLGLETGGQTEERDQRLGREEDRELGDPPA